MAVPYTFGTATSSIPLSQLDSNFNTVITLGNTAIQLGNTVTTLNNMTLANVTISSGNVTITNVAITTANVTTANITTAVIGTETVTTSTITTANVTTANITTDNITNGTVITSLTLSYGTANGVAYLNGSKVLTSGSALTFDGSRLGVGVNAASYSSKIATNGNISAAQGANLYLWDSTDSTGVYIYNSNNSSFAFGAYGGSEYMRINNSGNVGIGTSSPPNKLTSWGGGTLPSAVANAQLLVGDTTGFANAGIALVANASNASSITFGSTASPTLGRIEYDNASNYMRMLTNSTERMRIDSSGNLLVGITSGVDGRIKVDGTGNANNCAVWAKNSGGSSNGNYVCWNAVTTGDPIFVDFYTETSATRRGTISYNRAGGLVAYNVTSDYRAKDIYGPVIGSGALIDSVPVYMGKMKDATQERPMFIAHEVPAYAHTGEKDAVDADGKPVYQQMDASALIPVMWAEIQSLRKRLADAGIA